jgi:hypothetical protein
MCAGGLIRPHFVQFDFNISFCGLPGGFTSSQTAADNF